MNDEIGAKIKDSTVQWLNGINMIQKDLAQKLGMSPATLNQMLKGNKDLPLSRFLQIVHVIKPEQSEVDRVFGLYCQDLNLPAGALRLTIGRPAGTTTETARERLHALVDKLNEEDCATVEMMLRGLIRK